MLDTSPEMNPRLLLQEPRAALPNRPVADREQYAVIRIDNDGKFRSWNPSIERMLGYSEAEFLGKPSALLFTREDIAAGKPEMELQLAKRIQDTRHTEQTHYDCWHVRKDGSRFFATCIITAADQTQRHSNAFTKIIHDNTARRHSQDSLRSAKDELERRVIERTLELSQAINLLEQQLSERQQLETALLEASETERERLGQDLHDGVCQQLTGTAMLARVLGINLQRRAAPEAAEAQRIVDMIRAAVDQARGLAKGLHPVAIYTHKGLVAALEELTARTSASVDCQLHCPALLEIPPDTALHLYRIAQEAVGNALKHARASQIHIALTQSPGHPIELSVSDNGVGMAKDAESSGGMGLMNLQYRARAIGAKLAIDSQPGGGTTVRCTLPASISKWAPPSPLTWTTSLSH